MANLSPTRPRTHPVLVDLVIAAAISMIGLAIATTEARTAGAALSVRDVAASLLAFILLVSRRRYPVQVLVLAVIGAVLSMKPTPEPVVLAVVALIALYTVASTTNRMTAWSAGAATALALIAGVWVAAPGHWAETLAVIAWTGMATAAGEAVRNRRGYLKAVEERAERAERALKEEARRQVVEERLRIARELHDVVAHHIALINVQAGVASHLLRDDPDGASKALGHVRQGARSVLDELGGILSVLRQPEDLAEPMEPLPTLEQLDQLVDSFTAAGLGVERRIAGARRPLPPAVTLIGYRIVQESLTNVHKHGGGAAALLRLDYGPDELSIEVVNGGGGSDVDASNRPGHGIVGMRERVAAVSGTLDIGLTPDGRFRVFARLPIPAEAM